VPRSCAVGGADALDPRATWADKDAYDETARRLAGMFRENFQQYEEYVTPQVLAAGPTPKLESRRPQVRSLGRLIRLSAGQPEEPVL